MKRILLAAALLPLSALASAQTYATDLQPSHILPDPQDAQSRAWKSQLGENIIADNLNASLDLWQMCGWGGAEANAAAFVTWSRTHITGDHHDPDHIQPAYLAYGEISATKNHAMSRAVDRSAMCQARQSEIPALKAEMDRQTDALMRAHMHAHPL